MSKLFKNMKTLEAAMKILGEADLKNGTIRIAKDPDPNSKASIQANINAVVRVGEIDLLLDLKDLIIEVK